MSIRLQFVDANGNQIKQALDFPNAALIAIPRVDDYFVDDADQAHKIQSVSYGYPGQQEVPDTIVTIQI